MSKLEQVQVVFDKRKEESETGGQQTAGFEFVVQGGWLKRVVKLMDFFGSRLKGVRGVDTVPGRHKNGHRGLTFYVFVHILIDEIVVWAKQM